MFKSSFLSAGVDCTMPSCTSFTQVNCAWLVCMNVFINSLLHSICIHRCMYAYMVTGLVRLKPHPQNSTLTSKLTHTEIQIQSQTTHPVVCQDVL